MQHLAVGLLLDEGAREVAGVACVLAVVVVLAVFQAVAAPAVLLVGPGGTVGHPAVADWRDSPTVRPASPPLAPASAVRQRAGAGSALVETARRYLGVPYVFGGINPAVGLDCSGLVQLVYRQVGLSLPRTAQQQYDATPRVGRDELQPGDLVFFARTYADPHDWITHVGIYLGDGLQINAPTKGQVVSIQPVFSGYWGAHYAGAGRAANA